MRNVFRRHPVLLEVEVCERCGEVCDQRCCGGAVRERGRVKALELGPRPL